MIPEKFIYGLVFTRPNPPQTLIIEEIKYVNFKSTKPKGL